LTASIRTSIIFETNRIRVLKCLKEHACWNFEILPVTTQSPHGRRARNPNLPSDAFLCLLFPFSGIDKLLSHFLCCFVVLSLNVLQDSIYTSSAYAGQQLAFRRLSSSLTLRQHREGPRSTLLPKYHEQIAVLLPFTLYLQRAPRRNNTETHILALFGLRFTRAVSSKIAHIVKRLTTVEENQGWQPASARISPKPTWRCQPKCLSSA
jgi:hypothetical protein